MDIVLTAVRLALGSILANRFRSLLTMIGVLISVASVMMVVSATQGSADAVAEKLATSAGMLRVRPNTMAATARMRAQPFLTEGDVRAIAAECDHVDVASGVVEQRVVASVGKNVPTRVVGVVGPYFEMNTLQFSSGESWAVDQDVHTAIAVLGAVVAKKLFGPVDPIGREIRIGRVGARVIGVIKATGGAVGGDFDDRVYMPLRLVQARIVPSRDHRVDIISVRPKTKDVSQAARAEVTALLKQRYHGRQDFRIVSEDAALLDQQETIRTLSLLFLTVATVSLIVGGVGVMNIMLVSVAERTREIGIRVSIGAQPSDILLQYLVEAVTLTLLGGILGVGCGMLGGGALAQQLELDEVHFTMKAALSGIGVSVGMGILFGLLPALRAARLDPIEALRSE
jgi:putative ABC transport system permease protein